MGRAEKGWTTGRFVLSALNLRFQTKKNKEKKM
jgi:hypothetical protein